MYKIALKAPRGKVCKTYTCSENINTNIDISNNINIDEWLYNTVLLNKIWTSELFYNDDPPDSMENIHSGGGHCKGIIVWNETEVGWLIHTLPNWPETLLNPLSHAECEYGQSFIWITLPINKLPTILKQLQIMHSHIYHDTSKIFIPLKHPSEDQLINLVELDSNLYHIAKHNKWGKDLFEDGLVVDFHGSTWKTETWGRPLQTSTTNVERIHKVCWDDVAYYGYQDHSKWAVSDYNTSCVWIGDINAMTSQFHRGGGGLIIRDELLWKLFNEIISE